MRNFLSVFTLILLSNFSTKVEGKTFEGFFEMGLGYINPHGQISLPENRRPQKLKFKLEVQPDFSAVLTAEITEPEEIIVTSEYGPRRAGDLFSPIKTVLYSEGSNLNSFSERLGGFQISMEGDYQRISFQGISGPLLNVSEKNSGPELNFEMPPAEFEQFKMVRLIGKAEHGQILTVIPGGYLDVMFDYYNVKRIHHSFLEPSRLAWGEYRIGDAVKLSDGRKSYIVGIFANGDVIVSFHRDFRPGDIGNIVAAGQYTKTFFRRLSDRVSGFFNRGGERLCSSAFMSGI